MGYLFLALAIVGEVIATTFLKLTSGEKAVWWAYPIVGVGYVFAFTMLSLTLAQGGAARHRLRDLGRRRRRARRDHQLARVRRDAHLAAARRHGARRRVASCCSRQAASTHDRSHRRARPGGTPCSTPCCACSSARGPAESPTARSPPEAGVPLSAATYYFATLDDLYVSALRRATEEQVALFAQPRRARPAGHSREAMHDWAHANRGAAIAQYELMFLAMRRDALRADAELWYRSLEARDRPGAAASRAHQGHAPSPSTACCCGCCGWVTPRRSRRSRRPFGRLLQRLLHEHGAEPAVELEADLAHVARSP